MDTETTAAATATTIIEPENLSRIMVAAGDPVLHCGISVASVGRFGVMC